MGVTNDILRRMTEHNRGKSIATKGRGPWVLVYKEIHKTSQQAKNREYQVKQKKRKSYIEWLINNQNGSLV